MVKKNKIAKEMNFTEILKKNPDSVKVFLKYDMHCIGCPMAQQETLEEGCKAHGIDADKLVKEINKEEK